MLFIVYIIVVRTAWLRYLILCSCRASTRFRVMTSP